MSNTPVTTTSKQWTLNAKDFLKGLLIAVIAAVVPVIMDSINEESLTFNWKKIGTVALAAGLAYLLKNLMTPSQIVITNPEMAKEVKEGDAEVKVVPK